MTAVEVRRGADDIRRDLLGAQQCWRQARDLDKPVAAGAWLSRIDRLLDQLLTAEGQR